VSTDTTGQQPAVERFQRPLLAREGTRPVRVEPVDGTLLRPVAGRPPLGDYLDLLWRRRHFIWADARARVLSGTRGNLLGTAWMVLDPVLNGAVYYVIFGLLLRTSRNIDNFLGYLIIGVFLFRFTTQCLTQGSRSVITGRQLVTSFAFPRAALPVAAVVRQTLRFVPVLVVMVVLIAVIPPTETVTWRWALVPGVLALQLVLNLGLALLTARAVTTIPDLGQLIPLFTRFWLYASAVFFSYERFIDHPVILEVVQLNPMFIVLDITRDCLLYGQTPTAQSWLILTAWSVALLVVGTVYFWRGEESYGSV